MSRREDALLRLSGLAEEANAMGYDEAATVIRDMVQVLVEESDAPAAGPWHKWPETSPTDAKGFYLVRTANGGMDALLWVPSCPEFWMDDPRVTHWAEILPPREP